MTERQYNLWDLRHTLRERMWRVRSTNEALAILDEALAKLRHLGLYAADLRKQLRQKGTSENDPANP